MTVPPALLSHDSTEHYTHQYILDAVIACMGAIDLDPRPATATRSRTCRQRGTTQLWITDSYSRGRAGDSQSSVRIQGRAVFLEVISGAGRRPELLQRMCTPLPGLPWQTGGICGCPVTCAGNLQLMAAIGPVIWDTRIEIPVWWMAWTAKTAFPMPTAIRSLRRTGRVRPGGMCWSGCGR